MGMTVNFKAGEIMETAWLRVRSTAGAVSNSRVTTAIALFLAAACFSAWQYNLVPLATEWGDVGTWATAVLTGGGLIFAGLSVRAQTEQRRQQDRARKDEVDNERTALAHAVAISSWWAKDEHGQNCVCFRIANRSSNPVNQVTVRVWDTMDERDEAWSEKAFDIATGVVPFDIFLDRKIGTLLPGDELAEAVRVDHPMSGQNLRVQDVAVLLFTDVWGTSWRRSDTATEKVDGATCLCPSCNAPDDRVMPIIEASPLRPQIVKHHSSSKLFVPGG